MKTLSQFMTEAYDKDVMGSSQIRKTGEGGRVGADRRKSDAEIRRTKLGPGGTRVAAKRYKDRKDVGTQKQASDRVQQPEKERGTAALSAKEAQRKAYKERKARERAGAGAGTAKDKEKAASKLLTKKTPAKAKTGEKIDRTTKRQYTRDEKKKMVRAGKRLQKDLQKGIDRPASNYQP